MLIRASSPTRRADWTLGGALHRYAGFEFGGSDGERGLDACHVLGRGQLLGDEALEFGEIARDAEQDEVDLAREHMAAAHLRPGARLILEGSQVSFCLAGEPDKGEGG